MIKYPACLFSIALQAGYAESELDNCWLLLEHHEHEPPLPQHAVGALLV